jgi:UDP-N-acetylmuramoyl-L-alanyl-D-glutamate--2,6-diaminopimelate ligase
MECLCASRGRAVFADAAYRPEDVEKALGLLRRHTAGKLTVLLGSVGGRAKARRAPLGRAAERGADLVYLTADDPDTENAEEICLEMAAGFSDPARYVILPDRRGAILRAVRELREGDVLLLCGKGAQQYQLIGGKQLPFCEKEIVEAAMARR